MGCVNKNSKEFKALAVTNNVDANVLELIVHKYWIETGSEEEFPSDVYILSQLGRIPYYESSAIVRDFWKKMYSDSQYFNSFESLQKALNKAMKYFPSEAIKYYKGNNGKFILKVREPLDKKEISIRDIKKKDSYSKQELADYDLINRKLLGSNTVQLSTIEKQLNQFAEFLKDHNNSGDLQHLHDAYMALRAQYQQALDGDKDALNTVQFALNSIKLSKNIPFTFNDGISVTIPFMLNSQQIEALNAMSDFIKSNETSMTLSGYAGTGKTSLMEIIAQKMQKMGKVRLLKFSATTNKATAVLNDKVSKYGFKAQTLNKVFGIGVEINADEAYDAKNLVKVEKDADIIPGTTVVIDEASMINEENYRTLNRIAKENGLKIIYVGDAAQLSPVNETQISKVFRNSDGKVQQLTTVERTGDNAILEEATNLRNDKPLSGESSFNKEGKGVAYIRPNNQKEIDKIIQHFVPELKTDPNFFRILAYRNATVASYNDKVRSVLGYTSPIPNVNEPMVGYTNWGYHYDKNGGTYDFINSEAYTVTSVRTPFNQSVYLSDGTTVVVELIPIVLEDGAGNQKAFNLLDIKGNSNNRAAAEILGKEKAMLWSKVKTVPTNQKRDIYAKINNIDSYLFTNDDVKVGNRTLVSKVIDFGYAMTVHKSQGSTFTNVLVDDADIKHADKSTNNWTSSVDLGEETVLNPNNSVLNEVTDVDLDFSNGDSLIAEAPKPEGNTIDIIQQLEYVAVSRATDTVTILSNNVKKEDSPLNHEGSKKSQTTAQTEQKKAIAQEVKDLLKGTINQQLIQHFKSLGLSVKGRTEMEAFLKEHSTSIIQQFTTPLGEVYGFIDKDNNIYLDETVINPEHPIHEYTHLWDRQVAKHNPKLWNRGVELMKQTSLWKEVESSDNYGKQWKAMNLNQKKLESLIASEVHARLVGENGGKLLENIAKQKGAEDIIGKLKQWILDFWKEVKATFGQWSDEDLNSLTLKDFNHMVVRDLVDGIKPSSVKEVDNFNQQQPTQQSAQQGQQQSLPGPETKINIYAGTNENADLSNFAQRPFTLNNADTSVISEDGITFNSVEQAFQTFKLLEVFDDISEEKFDSLYKQLQAATPAQAKAIGRTIPMNPAALQRWNDRSSDVMKELISESFKQNPDATQKLLATGNATLTHTQDNTKWRTEFPRILMEVRDELSEQGAINQAGSRSNNLQQQKGSTQTVSLPGYEYFNELSEDTSVDADWKIPLLQELDSQLSNANSAEQNLTILNQMDKILLASSEEDVYNNTSAERQQEMEGLYDDFEKINQQINNLMSKDTSGDVLAVNFSGQEIRHISELVMNAVSDLVTDMQNDKDKAQKLFPSLKTDLNFQTATRKQIIETVGMNRLLYGIRRKFFDTENPNCMCDKNNVRISLEADKLYENFEGLITFGTDVFAMNEGFGFKRNNKTGNYELTQPSVHEDENTEEHEDQDSVEEMHDAQEHWQVEQRTIDILASATEKVRVALHQCYLLDKEGNKVLSRYGIPERVNPRDAMKSIITWTLGSQTLEEMVSRLDKKKALYPWLTQLVDRLSDKSGFDTDFQSQFFTTVCRSRQSYSIGLSESGKYKIMPVNNSKALSKIFNSVASMFRAGNHPLFQKGVNKQMLKTLHDAYDNLKQIKDALDHNAAFDEKKADDAVYYVSTALHILGFDVKEDVLREAVTKENLTIQQGKSYKGMVNYLEYIVHTLDKIATNPEKVGNAFAFGNEYSIEGDFKALITPIADVIDAVTTNVVYDDGKMYQEYVTPSYLSLLFQKFHQVDEKSFLKFLESEYGYSQWFKNKGGWRNRMLELMQVDSQARETFAHTVELNFNGKRYMRDMSPEEYTLSMLTHYWTEPRNGKGNPKVWYRVPIMSNKPSSEFFRWYAYTGSNYKDEVVSDLFRIYCQELSRIQTVRFRNRAEKDADFIKNFDKKGKEFCFLPVLNDFMSNSDDAKLRRQMLAESSKSLQEVEDRITAEECERLADLLQKVFDSKEGFENSDSELSKLVQKALRADLAVSAQRKLAKWEKNGILAAAKNIEGILPKEFINNPHVTDEMITLAVKSGVENFIWNDALASKNILQLTVGDIAFYKDAEDLQKRLAELHAPGIRPRTTATDYHGNRVSDGKYRTIVLKDWDNFTSNIIANITEVFDRRIANATSDAQREQLEVLKDVLVRPRTFNEDGSIKDNGGVYWNINVADAQGYSCPSSYRKKALMFGKWSTSAENIYQSLKANNFLKDDYNLDNLKTAFQPLKPFVYTQVHQEVGVSGSPIQFMPAPFQAKNSEYLLFLADAILQGEKTARPNLLRAIFRVMEESERLNPTKGIDTVQFESAIKSDLQGALDINQFAEDPEGEAKAYAEMMAHIYQYDNSGNRTADYNTRTYVKEMDYSAYCLQQEVPEHFKEHSQAQGSQERMIVPSDLDFTGCPCEWTDPDGTKRSSENAREVKRELEETTATSINEDCNNLRSQFGLEVLDAQGNVLIPAKSLKERKIVLSRTLQEEILNSPRYGAELFQACSIDKATGDFVIPLGDPTQYKRIEQLLNSVIKNRVNKQKIAGGPIVQVSNYGVSKRLHIRFHDRKGGILPLESEYNPEEHNGMTYSQYCKENQGGVAYYEVFAPVWDDKLYEMFGNANGTIDVKAIEKVCPELLQMISYRIPTEDKHSIAPMKVVGFMPKRAGGAIMLPYELTGIDGSDFDVDKRYVMRRDVPLKLKPKEEIKKQLIDIMSKKYSDMPKAKVAEQVKMFLDNPVVMRGTDEFGARCHIVYRNIAYTVDMPKTGKLYRDNKILAMTWGILTNEKTADKLLNPGGFDTLKKMGYAAEIYRTLHTKVSWQELMSKSPDQLKKMLPSGKDLSDIDTQIQFYRQNAAAASLIGVFAVNKIAHATLEGDDIYIDIEGLCGEQPFTIADKTFSGSMPIDPRTDTNGNFIGKTLGSGVSASADAAKEPCLNLMNVNMTTINILTTLNRLGMPLEDAALFLSQDVVTRLLDNFNIQNLTGYASFDKIIEDMKEEYQQKTGFTDTSVINEEPLTRQEMIQGIIPGEHVKSDYKTLVMLTKILSLANAMRNPTFVTRFNSISSAVGPQNVHTIATKYKMEQFAEVEDTPTHFIDSNGKTVGIETILDNHPILKAFAQTVNLALGDDTTIGLLSEMPSASRAFHKLLAPPMNARGNWAAVTDRLNRDSSLLGSLLDFYNSYLLVQNGLINPSERKHYIDEFPKEFIAGEYKKEYPDNPFVQSIDYSIERSTGKVHLNVNLTGEDEAKKSLYRSAWIDLHYANPKLSIDLLKYWFFRAGIGFSPKTGIALVPNYVKQQFSTTKEDGTAVSYNDVYKNLSEVNSDIVLDQFIRNNWRDSRLVPLKGGKGTHYKVANGELHISGFKDVNDVAAMPYIRTFDPKSKLQTLWKLEEEQDDYLIYKKINPLGNNGEYLEISNENIVGTSSTATVEKSDNHIETEAKNQAPDTTGEVAVNSGFEGKTDDSQFSKMTEMIFEYRNLSSRTTENTMEAAEKVKNNIVDALKSGKQKQFTAFVELVMKHHNIDYSIDTIWEKFNEYC